MGGGVSPSDGRGHEISCHFAPNATNLLTVCPNFISRAELPLNPPTKYYQSCLTSLFAAHLLKIHTS